MITETKTIFKCEYCNKLYQRKYFCEQHEKACFHNPANARKCLSCLFLHKKNVTIFEDLYDGEHEQIVNVFYCEKVNTCLYPPTVEHKKNQFEIDEYLNMPMKKECGYYANVLEELLKDIEA